MKKSIYTILLWGVILSSNILLSNTPTTTPPIVMLTNEVPINVNKSIDNLYIDCFVHDTDPFFVRLPNYPNRRYIITGNPGSGYGYIQTDTSLPAVANIQTKLKSILKNNIKDGIYMHAFIVDGMGNVVRNPRSLSNGRQGIPYVSFYDHNFNLLIPPCKLTGPWGGNGAGQFGNIPINYPFQTWRVVINNGLTFNVPYGVPVLLKQATSQLSNNASIELSPSVHFDPSLCNTPKPKKAKHKAKELVAQSNEVTTLSDKSITTITNKLKDVIQDIKSMSSTQKVAPIQSESTFNF